MALDIETGSVLKIFSALEEDNEKYGYELEALGTVFCKEGDDDYLYCLGINFKKIDVQTMGIVETYSLQNYEDDELLKGFESIMHIYLQGDYFTFHADQDDGYLRYIGVYDYVNRKAVWVHELITLEELRKTGNELMSSERVKMHGDKLYIKDFSQNLHVFEKEQTSI